MNKSDWIGLVAAATRIRVAARPESFWRAGRMWTRAGEDVDTASLTPEQIEAIATEPNLVVTVIESDPGKPLEPGGTKPKPRAKK